MFKLLVVDDEKIVIDAVSFIIEKDFKEVIRLEAAKSGREAIEKCQNFNPDIVLMDIRMPGINGIDAIKEIKNIRSNIFFIIISAYEQFEFAKEAVKLGVSDYILKPINKKNLVNSLENVIKKLTEEREKKLIELENLEKYENIIPFLEQGFIYSILLGESHGSKINSYKEMLGLGELGGYILILESRKREVGMSLGEKLELDAKQAYYQVFRDALKYRCNCLIGSPMLDRIVAFISTEPGNDYSERLETYKIASYVYDKLSVFKDDLIFSIGIGSYKRLENISVSYEEALKALQYFKDKGIVHIKDITDVDDLLTEYPKDQEKRLLEMIILGNKQGALEAFKRIFDWVNLNYKNSLNIGKWKLIELMVIIERTVFDFGVKEGSSVYLEAINNMQDYLIIENDCRERILYILDKISDMQEKKVNNIIVHAKGFINTYFKNEITLEDVSKEVSVSPHYFSRLFKEETGENFINYLTKIRINNAKELMKGSNLSIKEICFNVGYSDPNYFSSLFKKVEKVTPSIYIKNLNKG